MFDQPMRCVECKRPVEHRFGAWVCPQHLDRGHVEPVPPLFQPHVGPSRGSIEEDFRASHAENPHVYHLVRNLTMKAHEADLKRVGMKMIFELIRWQHAIMTQGDQFKLNNSFTAYYTRLLAHREPMLGELFITRSQKDVDHGRQFDPSTVKP